MDRQVHSFITDFKYESVSKVERKNALAGRYGNLHFELATLNNKNKKRCIGSFSRLSAGYALERICGAELKAYPSSTCPKSLNVLREGGSCN